MASVRRGAGGVLEERGRIDARRVAGVGSGRYRSRLNVRAGADDPGAVRADAPDVSRGGE
jgi:hypothetical protein